MLAVFVIISNYFPTELLELNKFIMTPFLAGPTHQLLSAGSLPGETTLWTYCFLYWRQLLAETKTEPLPGGKQSRSATAVPFEVDMFAERKQPPALKRQNPTNNSDQLCHVFCLGWVMWTLLWSRLRCVYRRSYLNALWPRRRSNEGKPDTEDRHLICF